MTCAVRATEISVRFGEYQALDNVSLCLDEGAFLAIIGPNGAGKSTLLNVLLGIRAPDKGVVSLFDAPPTVFPGPLLGYVPQVKTIDRSFPARAVELVVTGLRRGWPWRVKRSERELALRAMQQVGVAQVADRPLARLSGGELQRVFLARVLVRRPKLLVLDEPAAGMDVSGEAEMYHILDHYRRETGATVLMITHDWEGARFHATHVLLLNRKVIGFGPPSEVVQEENLLRVFGHVGHIKASHGTDQYA